jgi:hypothetical protein
MCAASSIIATICGRGARQAQLSPPCLGAQRAWPALSWLLLWAGMCTAALEFLCQTIIRPQFSQSGRHSSITNRTEFERASSMVRGWVQADFGDQRVADGPPRATGTAGTGQQPKCHHRSRRNSPRHGRKKNAGALLSFHINKK